MSHHDWDAGGSIDEELVRHLISSQFPELPLRALHLLADGWDNAVWLVNEEWAFRFPRLSGVVPGIEREMNLLPRLAPRMPLPIPVPKFFGRPADGYPAPFFGARLIPGVELAETGLPDEGRVPAARQLGAFLRRLHEPTLAAEFDAALPRRPERTDIARSLPQEMERMNAVASAGLWNVPPQATELVTRAAALPMLSETVLVHGDLHVRHLLVDEAGDAAGVIDWGDISLAHPSIDLQIGWSGFSGMARAAFLEAYGPVPNGWTLRARLSALFYSATLALYAHRDGLQKLKQEAIAGLRRATDDAG